MEQSIRVLISCAIDAAGYHDSDAFRLQGPPKSTASTKGNGTVHRTYSWRCHPDAARLDNWPLSRTLPLLPLHHSTPSSTSKPPNPSKPRVSNLNTMPASNVGSPKPASPILSNRADRVLQFRGELGALMNQTSQAPSALQRPSSATSVPPTQQGYGAAGSYGIPAAGSSGAAPAYPPYNGNQAGLNGFTNVRTSSPLSYNTPATSSQSTAYAQTSQGYASPRLRDASVNTRRHTAPRPPLAYVHPE